MRRAAAILLLIALVVTGCGGRVDVYEVPPDAPSGATRALELPDPVPAVPAFRVDLKGDSQPNDLKRVAKTPGVAVVGQVALREMKVVGADGLTAKLVVGAASPLDYRSVAPASTRDADFVWTALMAGRAVVTFDTAEVLGLSEGGEISIGDQTVQVGAFADNGIPNIADVLVADNLGSSLGLGPPGVLVVGVSSGSTLQSVGNRLRDRVGSFGKIKRLLPETPITHPAPPPQPTGAANSGVIGSMSFTILKNGFIIPDPAWVASNIAIGDVPLIGSVTCHRLMFPQLRAALSEIESAGLSSELHTADGCYVPRFIDRDPGKPLSMHAFGLAIDLNAATNQLGTRGDMDPQIVEIFERWGFDWGGRWARPDPMHFELARLIQT
ncbi:MAG: hypothetical protein QOG54_329 [Actinomycetota bacterium]|jgi:hypothetical protein|nr:hypothetical protein [Actinomycetota bacterium]